MNLFDLQATLSLDKTGYDSGITEASRKASAFASAVNSSASSSTSAMDRVNDKTGTLTSSFSKLSAVAGAAVKVGAVAIAGLASAAVGGVGVLTQSAVSSYSKYEQMVGGIESIFQGASKTVIANAESAYKTSNLSANAYMETVTAFAGSLINSLKGDTEAAAKYADLALQDMADNVNKFGTSMESVRYAYIGFSRQNYTMLDNLKLGYGGTASEMARLINDTKVMNNNIKYTADTVKQVPFEKMIEAIHKVQENMHVAGATAEESMKTIEGSVKMTTAAWENLKTAIAGGGSLEGAFKQLTTAIFGENEGEGLLANIIPRVQKTLEGISSVIEMAAPTITKKIPELMNAVLPSLVDAGIKLASSLAAALPSMLASIFTAVITAIRTNIPTILAAAKSIGTQLVEALQGDSASMLTVGMDWLKKLAEGVSSGVTGLIETVAPMLATFTASLRENGGKLVDAGLALLESIAAGIADGMPAIAEAAPRVINDIVSFITENLPKILAAGVYIVGKLAEGIISSLPTLLSNADLLLGSLTKALLAFGAYEIGVAIVKHLAAGLMSSTAVGAIQAAGTAISYAFRSFASGASIFATMQTLMSTLSGIAGVLKASFVSLGASILPLAPYILAAVAAFSALYLIWQNWDTITTTVSAAWETIKQTILAVTEAIETGLTEVWTRLTATLPQMWNNLATLAGVAWNAVSGVVISVATMLSQTLITIWTTISTQLTALWTNLSNACTSAWGSITAVISSILTAMATTISSFAVQIQTTWNSLWNSIVAFAGGIWANILASAGTFFSSLQNSVTNGLNAAWQTFTGKLNEIAQLFNPARWIQYGANLIDGIVQGVMNAASRLYAAVKNVVNSALGTAETESGTHSPSTVWRDEIGKMLTLGMAEGVESGSAVNALADAVKGVVSGATDAAGEMDIPVMQSTYNGGNGAFGNMQAALSQISASVSGGNFTIPVYIGQDRLDTAIVKAQQRQLLVSGGR